MEKTKLGIIGHGRFGKLVERIIKENFKQIEIVIFDKGSNFRRIKDCKILVVAVPISDFKEAILEIKDFIKPHTLVVDVCSVKMHPVKIMVKFLPSSSDIIATHPLFGPDSAKDGLDGLKIVVCKTRCNSERLNEFKKNLQRLGLKIIEMSAEEHDKLIARTQLFTHMIGRIGEKMDIEKTSIDTISFKKLFEVQQTVTNDSLQLFLDMNKFNPFAKKLRAEMKFELDNLERQI